jgi:hypothetical protein
MGMWGANGGEMNRRHAQGEEEEASCAKEINGIEEREWWKIEEDKRVNRSLIREGVVDIGTYYRTMCTCPKGKGSGRQIGITRGYPITVTSTGYLFLFRVDGMGETSLMTWGLKRQRLKYL